MYIDQISLASADTSLVARNSLAAGQWEAHLLDAGIARGETELSVTSFADWLASGWEEWGLAGGGATDRSLLTPGQTLRLWEKVIAESDEGEMLLARAGTASWARIARSSLFAADLQPGALGGLGWQGDSSAFLRWNRRFEQVLTDRGWIDPESLLCELEVRQVLPGTGGLLLLDPLTDTPPVVRLVARFRDAGRSAAIVRPSGCVAQPDARLLRDPGEELQSAVGWASQRLDQFPSGRLAIVFPDLGARRQELVTTFAGALGTGRLSAEVGQPLTETGVFGAAMSLIDLLTSASGFEALSRWLRSPFFHSATNGELDEAARLERRLRSDARSGEAFVEAYRRYGLRAAIAGPLPDLAGRLDQVLERLPLRATPTGWVQFWQTALRIMGWSGLDTALPDRLHAATERVWSGFAELTPLLGLLDAAEARAELQKIASAEEIHEPLSLSGAHLLTALTNIGPGYAGSWIAGFSDQAWPPAAGENPLVPWRVRFEHKMPGADPANDLARAADELAGLLARVPEAVFSCPQRVLDQPQVPSPEFAAWAIPAGDARASLPDASLPASTAAVREFEVVDDPAPPLAGRRIPGGPRTLDRQAVCPVVAFCTARLGAEPLERPIRGLDARLRGILLHRALELLCRAGASGNAAESTETALHELMPPGPARWQTQVRAERERCNRILKEFLALEASRSPFETTALERRTLIDLEGFELSCRIDRIDRLPDGGLLIFDYKTGRQLMNGWFTEPLSDCQLPLYAQQFGPEVAAISTILLGEKAIEFRSAGRLEDELPGRRQQFSADEWQRQLEAWHEQLAALVRDFARGDTRVPAEDDGAAAGAWAAVTRVLESGR